MSISFAASHFEVLFREKIEIEKTPIFISIGCLFCIVICLVLSFFLDCKQLLMSLSYSFILLRLTITTFQLSNITEAVSLKNLPQVLYYSIVLTWTYWINLFLIHLTTLRKNKYNLLISIMLQFLLVVGINHRIFGLLNILQKPFKILINLVLSSLGLGLFSYSMNNIVILFLNGVKKDVENK